MTETIELESVEWHDTYLADIVEELEERGVVGENEIVKELELAARAEDGVFVEDFETVHRGPVEGSSDD